MRLNQIGHVDIITHASPVGRGIVGAVYPKIWLTPKRGRGRNLYQMRRLRRRLAAAAARVGASHVEVTQGDVSQVMRSSRVACSMISIMSLELP